MPNADHNPRNGAKYLVMPIIAEKNWSASIDILPWSRESCDFVSNKGWLLLILNDNKL